MADTSNLLTAERFLRARLKASSALAAAVGTLIYSEEAPRGAHYPLVVYRWQGGLDVSTIKGVSLYLNELYAVKVICTGNDYGKIEAAAQAIQDTLQNATGTVSSGKVIFCVRENPLKYVETVDGITYRHLGGIYRIYSQ